MSIVPRLRRALLARLVPGIDGERVWRGLDVRAPRPGEVLLEARLAALLAPAWRAIVPLILTLFAGGVAIVYDLGPRTMASMEGAGHPRLALAVPLACAVLVHGLYVLTVHEATHGNLLGRPADDWLGSLACGALLLPFTAETFPAVHGAHHRNTNRPGDTNWTPLRQRLYSRSRVLYALFELVPLLSTLDRLPSARPAVGPRVVVAWLAAGSAFALLRPPLGYWCLVVCGLNLVTTLRFWTEHFGHLPDRVANTYRFPLGFGIGNHEVHHAVPSIPALALAIGLCFRAKEASVLAAPLRVLFAPGYRHLRSFAADGTALAARP